MKNALNNWRDSKQRPNEQIPFSLWKQIIDLLKIHSNAEICKTLGLYPSQIRRGKQIVAEARNLKDRDNDCPGSDYPNTDDELIEFCEGKENSHYPLAAKPAEAFVTNTSIVELYRPN